MRFLQGQLANVSGELRVKNPHCIPQPAYPNVSLSVVCEPPPPTPAPTRSVKTDDDVDAAAPSRCAETPPAYTDLDVQIEGEPQVIFTEEEAIHAAHGLRPIHESDGCQRGHWRLRSRCHPTVHQLCAAHACVLCGICFSTRHYQLYAHSSLLI